MTLLPSWSCAAEKIAAGMVKPSQPPTVSMHWRGVLFILARIDDFASGQDGPGQRARANQRLERLPNHFHFGGMMRPRQPPIQNAVQRVGSAGMRLQVTKYVA